MTAIVGKGQRNRAAGLLVASSLVLLQRKQTDGFWALPGGEIEHGESAQQALGRELREELGWEPVTARLFCVAESLFTHGSQLVQQIGFYFLTTAEALWQQQGCRQPHEEFAGWDSSLVLQWCPQADLAGLDVRPAALVPLFRQPPPAVVHCVSGFAP